jgi:hypothetical protein
MMYEILFGLLLSDGTLRFKGKNWSLKIGHAPSGILVVLFIHT